MIKVGIIAEYNPLHCGHEYQIQYAKRVLKADLVVIIMSGNFTQRGLPAICDKKLRAEAAIEVGADVILEMPPIVAVADTPLFAQGAVDILIEYGCNAILFGSENDDIELLKTISKYVAVDEYWQNLEEIKKTEKLSPDDARVELCSKLLGDKSIDYSFINKPNNLLGIYYISAIYRRKKDINIYTNKRLGQDYFERDIPSNCEYASATSIRMLIKDLVQNRSDLNCDEMKKYLPVSMVEKLSEAYHNNTLVFHEDFFELYMDAIRNIHEDEWNLICPMLPYKQIKYQAKNGASFESVIEIALEYMPEFKLFRIFNWILLHFQPVSLEKFIDSDYVGWQVLASREDGANKGEIYASSTLMNEWHKIDALYEQVQIRG